MNDVTEPSWHQWIISLKKFADNNDVQLDNVTRITIGFGDNVVPYGNGIVFFDDIRLYTRRCIGPGPIGDLSGDCVVNFRDFAILANEWLDTGCCEADLYKDYKVDFEDLAILADNWLVE
jgi:hypothetical protein